MKDDPVARPAGLTLVLGGVRSGKSAFAERLALAAGDGGVTYVATARAGDAGMADRVAGHRRRRAGYGWRTVEEPVRVADAVAAAGGCVLVECVPLWLTGLLCDPAGPDDAGVAAAVEGLAAAAVAAAGPVVVVSAEAGLGLVPPNELARRFADRLGEANQRLAAAADAVWLVVAGLPVPIKRPTERETDP